MGCTSSKAAAKVEDPSGTRQSGAAQAGPSSSERPKPTSALTTPRASGLREAEEKPLVIFVIGGPGSGKGTQCEKIVKKYGGGCRHLSTGELLRAEVERGTKFGKELKAKMKSGSLVSDDQMIALLEKEISASAWFGTAFLLDGFPRTVAQAHQFDEQIRPCDMILYFECPEDVMVQRLTERSKSSGRQDDNPTTVKRRLKTFQKQSLPVVKAYSGQPKLHTISAVPPPDEVFEAVVALLDKTFNVEPAPEVVDPKTSSEWRPKEVVDIETRFYGERQ